MTAILIGLAFLLGGMTGGALGLWYGERQNRIAWQNMKLHGAPDGVVKAQVTITEDLPETRILQSGFSDKTISKGMESLMREAAAEGRPISPEDARQVVLKMLDPDAEPELMI